MRTLQADESQVIENGQYDLIKGDYSPEDASEIINHLLLKKINYHKLRSFSRQIRYGEVDEYSLQRIEELEQCKESIRALVLQAREQGKSLRLESTISIELI
jgi:hypothetical protein